MYDFKASEVFDVAVRIEQNGESLYRHACTLTDDAKIKDLFALLADEEVKHRKTFEGMQSKVEDYQPPEKYPGEYCSYLRAYADDIVFPSERMESELARITDVGGAIEFAVQREIESILYYLEARGFVSERQRDQVDKIIDEERRHYLRLMDIKKVLS
jgi:rubrerythrin